MKVRELIERLAEEPPDDEVVVVDETYRRGSILQVDRDAQTGELVLDVSLSD